MPVLGTAERPSRRIRPADEKTLIPPAEAAPGPPAATCRECKVTVRFMRGYDPVPVSWDGDVCPACRRAQIKRMDEAEQRDEILAAIRNDPEAPATELARRTGTGLHLARQVRRAAIKSGLALPLYMNGKAARAAKPAPRTKTQRTRRVEAGTAEVKAAVLAEPGSGAGDVADTVGIPRTTARRHLKSLIQAGEITSRKDGRNVRYFPAGSKSG